MRLALLTFVLSSPLMALTLNDIRPLTQEDRAALAARYPSALDAPELFSDAQLAMIAERGLQPLVAKLLLHPKIVFDDPQLVVDFALTIADSNLSFDVLEPRLVRYIKEKMLPFDALERAIDRERFHQWKVRQVEKVKKQNNPFLKSLNSMALKPEEHEKVLGVYATCVAPYWDEREREALRPTRCGPNPEYKKPRHDKFKIPVHGDESSEASVHALVYQRFVEEMQKTAEWNELDTFDRIKMSKCVAEQSLHFFQPFDEPLKGLKKVVQMCTKSPAEAFFMHSGVCGNFATMMHALAQNLGLEGHVFLAKKSIHIYLEFEELGQWYHTHAFNSAGSCDIIRF